MNNDEPVAWLPPAKLSIRQAEILNEIRRVTSERGLPPSLREVGQTLDIPYGSVKWHIDKLVELGFMKREPGLSRAARVATGWLPGRRTT